MKILNLKEEVLLPVLRDESLWRCPLSARTAELALYPCDFGHLKEKCCDDRK